MIRTLSLVVVALGFSLSAHAAPMDDANAFLKSLGDAFNKGDAKAAAMLGTEDSDVINPAGVAGKGRAENEKIIAADLNGILKGATNKFTADSVREVGTGAWLVDATHEAANMTGPDGKKMTGKLHVVLVLVKGKDGKLAFTAVRPYMFLPPMPAPAAAPAPMKK
jgi:ketosteroid isomerase-like protein